MAQINILMCGGRRIGKTSIMAAIEKNVQDEFQEGNVILTIRNAGKLQDFRNAQRALRDDYSIEYFYPEAEETAAGLPTKERTDFEAELALWAKKTDVSIRFSDVPGEWFVRQDKHEEIVKLIQESHILILAIDTPYLMEEEGRFHHVFNRPDDLCQKIQEAWQNDDARMVLFAPLKCEKYVNKNQMEAVAEKIKQSYADFISYLRNRKNCEIAITPCITIGGLEFINFEPYDEDKLDLGIFQKDGQWYCDFRSKYAFLYDINGDRFYTPRNCEQPLLYSLLFVIMAYDDRLNNIFLNIWAAIRKCASKKDIIRAKPSIESKLNISREEGFAVLSDPLNILGKSR